MSKMISVEALRKALPAFTRQEQAILKSALNGPQPSSSRSRGPMRVTTPARPVAKAHDLRKLPLSDLDMTMADLDDTIRTIVRRVLRPDTVEVDRAELDQTIKRLVRERVADVFAGKGIREFRR